MQDLIESALILFALSVITTGLIILLREITRKHDKIKNNLILETKLHNNAVLIRYCQRSDDKFGERTLIEERYNLIKERNFFK